MSVFLTDQCTAGIGLLGSFFQSASTESGRGATRLGRTTVPRQGGSVVLFDSAPGLVQLPDRFFSAGVPPNRLAAGTMTAPSRSPARRHGRRGTSRPSRTVRADRPARRLSGTTTRRPHRSAERLARRRTSGRPLSCAGTWPCSAARTYHDIATPMSWPTPRRSRTAQPSRAAPRRRPPRTACAAQRFAAR